MPDPLLSRQYRAKMSLQLMAVTCERYVTTTPKILVLLDVAFEIGDRRRTCMKFDHILVIIKKQLFGYDRRITSAGGKSSNK
ncbi:Hypothetical protein NTJ_14074 [Nesidiocoris tenuis]|uniref:Uncharacterized protein n=1 Tax=Nesidiocoris tenuis TaxID=355587 RepID=A0ABN7BEI6_9HEMI|nr:Hypothetical protein NTJ_14074 [Nesidiocoris tenuis]